MARAGSEMPDLSRAVEQCILQEFEQTCRRRRLCVRTCMVGQDNGDILCAFIGSRSTVSPLASVLISGSAATEVSRCQTTSRIIVKRHVYCVFTPSY